MAEEGDMFEALLHLEDRLVQEGLQNGRLNAHQVAFEDGRQLGLAKGAEVGHELGFYFGHLFLWRCLHPPPPPSAAAPPPRDEDTAAPPRRSDAASAHLSPPSPPAEEQSRPHHQHRRAVEAMGRLQELVCSFPRDPTREDLFEQLDRIRGKYRQTASLLKAPAASARYPGYPTTSPSPSPSPSATLPSADDGQPRPSSSARLAF